MVRCLCIVFITLIISLGRDAFAQFTVPNDSITVFYDPSEITSQNFLRTDEDIFSEELQFFAEDIERIASHKINISSASWKDLQLVPTLSDLDIRNILQSRKNNLSEDILRNSEYFLQPSSVPLVHHVFIRSRVVLDPDVHEQPLYPDHIYQGSPVKTMSRIIAMNDDIIAGLVEAKSAGEPMYFDHVSGCIAINK